MSTIQGGIKIEGSLDRPFENAGAPSDGGGGTLAGIAEKGALLIDTTNANLYQNSNTKASPTWTQFAEGAGGGPAIGLIGEMAADGTSTANAIGVVTKYAPVDHVHKLGDHDHTGDAGDGAQIGPDSFASGAFTADANGRDPFAAGLVDNTILGDGAVDDADKFAAGALAATATGRAVMAANFFDAATAEDKFADSSIPSDKVNWAFGDTPNVIQCDDTATEGTSLSPARGDHEHGIVCASPVDGSLRAANAEGAAVSFARSDHAHSAILLDGIEFEFGTDSDAVIGWEVGDVDNETLVVGLADANQAIHFTDKSAIGTDWNVAADTHPSVYVHSNTTPATDYLKAFHDSTDGWLRSVGGTLKLDAPTGSTVNVCVNAVVEVAFSATTVDLNDNALDNAGFLILNAATAPANTEVYLVNDNTGDLTLNALAGKTVNIAVAGTDEYTFSATVADFGTNGLQFGTNPADAGNVRVPNDTAVWSARNQANGANITGWKVNAEDDYEAAADVNLGGNIFYGGTAANADLNLRGTTNGTTTTAYVVAGNKLDCTVEGLATRVKAGAVGDGETNQTDLNGDIAIDSANGRIYFRYGAAWHYAAQTAGVTCPESETVCPKCDAQMGVGQEAQIKWNETQDDGALHGLWEHVVCP